MCGVTREDKTQNLHVEGSTEVADSRQQTEVWQTADSRQQTADSRQQTADSRQQTSWMKKTALAWSCAKEV